VEAAVIESSGMEGVGSNQFDQFDLDLSIEEEK
jgi:hypothetical protein